MDGLAQGIEGFESFILGAVCPLIMGLHEVHLL
jgi:hypothetical protein